ncbi:hypothetical protein K439DRAFT_1372156, partial [Ramaria rubella]
WQSSIMLSLIIPYLDILRQTQHLTLPIPPSPPCLCGHTETTLQSTCVQLDKLDVISISTCKCTILPLHLLHGGLFPCAPC